MDILCLLTWWLLTKPRHVHYRICGEKVEIASCLQILCRSPKNSKMVSSERAASRDEVKYEVNTKIFKVVAGKQQMRTWKKLYCLDTASMQPKSPCIMPMIWEQAKTLATAANFKSTWERLEWFMKCRGLLSTPNRLHCVKQQYAGKLHTGSCDFCCVPMKPLDRAQNIEDCIFAIDNMACWFDMLSDITVHFTGTHSVPFKTTRHKKKHHTIFCMNWWYQVYAIHGFQRQRYQPNWTSSTDTRNCHSF